MANHDPNRGTDPYEQGPPRATRRFPPGSGAQDPDRVGPGPVGPAPAGPSSARPGAVGEGPVGEGPRPSHRLPPVTGRDGTDLKTLLGELSRDATQLAHDELALAKLEIRDVADAFSADIQAAGQTVVKNLAKVGVALSLATLAGLALTAGAILAVGQLLGDAFWAGGLIVGAVLLIAAGVFGMSAARDLKESDALRMERGRRTLERDGAVLKEEARDTGDFARRESREVKRRVTRDVPRHEA